MTKWQNIQTAPVAPMSAFGFVSYCAGLIAAGLMVLGTCAIVLYYFPL